jgi:hypothetical protein
VFIEAPFPKLIGSKPQLESQQTDFKQVIRVMVILDEEWGNWRKTAPFKASSSPCTRQIAKNGKKWLSKQESAPRQTSQTTFSAHTKETISYIFVRAAFIII